VCLQVGEWNESAASIIQKVVGKNGALFPSENVFYI